MLIEYVDMFACILPHWLLSLVCWFNTEVELELVEFNVLELEIGLEISSDGLDHFGLY
jgi:hypothetical protein